MTAADAVAIDTIAVDVDVVVIVFVIVAIATGVFMAVWAVSRASASKQDVAMLSVRVDALERRADETNLRLGDLAGAVAHLPTEEDVHKIDIRLERVVTMVESTSHQVSRIHDHLMDVAHAKAAEAQGSKESRT